MDATQVIILTMIVNIIMSGIVGGIVIYAIQKKIDATNQKSIYEYQTKFARSYPRMLEALEGFIQLLKEHSILFGRFGYQLVFNLTGERPVDAEQIKTAKDELFEKTGKLSSFVLNNRLHLPDDLVKELEAINYMAFKLMIISLANDEASKDTDENFNKHFLTSSLFIDAPIDDITQSREKDLESLVKKVGDGFDKLLEQSEKIYKSVAEAKH